ncbi:MAG: MlaD family protein [Planctomycetota bacterium]
MTESDSNPSPGAHAPLPRAVVRESRRISVVWLIPIVAALSGGFLAWKAINERGPTITIVFDSAEGLEAEKTKIRYRDVEVGVVESIGFNDDLSKVEATASLVKWIEPHLTSETSFWVVTARVTAGEVSGLGTLLGGAYIGMEPSRAGPPERSFVGAPKPPLVSSEEEGSFFRLRSEDAGMLGIGAPVYFRSLEVGRLVEEVLDPGGEFFSMEIFVEAPHDRRVTTSTLFWNASGIDATFSPDGLQLNSPSVVSMLVGGIQFGEAEGAPAGAAPGEEEVFKLYASKSKAMEPHYVEKSRYLLRFDGSVAGLRPGAAVEFRGIPVGRVVDLTLQYDFDAGEMQIPVIIETEPERIHRVGEPTPGETQADRLQALVSDGLRARLASESLLTGALKVELEMVPSAAPAQILYDGEVPEFPTAPAALEGITDSLATTLARIEEVPLEEIGRKVDRLLGELESVATQFNREITPSVTESLGALQSTLESTDSMLGAESGTQQEVEQILREVRATVRSLRLLAERLEKHPEELLRGRPR